MKAKPSPFQSVSSFLAAALISLGSSAIAASFTWNSDLGGSYDGLWSDTSIDGWNGGPPVGGDTALIDNGTVTTTATNQQNGVALTIGSAGVLTENYYMYFSTTGTLTLNSGTINVTPNVGYNNGWRDSSLSSTVNANSGSSFINGSGGLRLEGNTTFSGAGNLTISPGLHNWTDGTNFAATSITKEGAGTLTLGGLGDFSGGTTVNGGTLALAANNPIGYGVGPAIINSGSLMTMTGNHSVNIGALTLNGGELSSGGFSDPTYGSYYMKGNVTAGTGTSTISAVNITSDGVRTFDVAAGGTLNVTGGFSSVYGAFGLTKTGDGTMVLSGANTYTGATNISGGTLSLATPFLDDNAPITIGFGAVLALNFVGNDTVGSLEIDGSGPLPAGLYNSSHVTYGSYFSGGGSLEILAQDGTWTSLVNGNWSDSANWDGNIIAVGTDNTATFNAAAGVTVTLDTNRIIGNLAFDVSDYIIDGANLLTFDASTASTIGVTTGRTATINTRLTSTAEIRKTGDGTLVLNGPNESTAGMAVNGGTLALTRATDNLLPSNSLTINSGGTVSLRNYNPMGAPFVTPVTINSGGLMTMSDNWSVNLGALTLDGGELSSGGFFDPIYGSYYLRNDVTVEAGTSTISAVKITAPGDRTFDVLAGGTLNVTGSFSSLFGSFGLTKAGAGTMVLSGANDYTGNTIVSEGTLALTSTSQLQFVVNDTPASNRVTGSGTATFDGVFNINTAAVSGTTGYIWSLVDRASLTGESFGANFSVAGFTQELDGVTWTMSDSRGTWSFSEDTGELTLDIGNDYDTWKTANGVTGGENDDDDSDGLTNHEEYAFGLDPTGGSSVNPILVQLNKGSGTFTYQRRKPSLTGLTSYKILTSTDLVTWIPDPTALQSATDIPSTDNESVAVTLTTAPTAAKFFVRVSAE
jgi:fibronectin-binding autotransporter adhesin